MLKIMALYVFASLLAIGSIEVTAHGLATRSMAYTVSGIAGLALLLWGVARIVEVIGL
jgi:hypothetical protein